MLVVHNPGASAADAGVLARLMEAHFAGRRVDYVECHREQLAARLQPWLADGARLIIAAGGDGTVSDIATALTAGGPASRCPIGILPMGTGNVLARELDLPLDLDEAAALLAGDFAVHKLDLLQVNGHAYLLSVSAGMTARAMRETGPWRKRIFGKSSYIVSLLLNFFAMHPTEFSVRADGEMRRMHASDVMVLNSASLGYKALRWWPEVRSDDGRMELCHLDAPTGLRYLWVVFNFLRGNHFRRPWLDYAAMQHSVVIEAPHGLAVQGDGDWIGETPVEVTLLPAALNVAVPRRVS